MLWIQTECRIRYFSNLAIYTFIHMLTLIRTISILSLLDCAFFFYQNYPCRLTHSEMECDFPCEETLFKSEHPYADPNFQFSRDLTIYKAFQSLFEPPESGHHISESNRMALTVMDMFILIHGKQSSLCQILVF